MSEESTRAWKDQYMLRLPDGMRDRIKRAAEANNRSMNAEIVASLEAIYPAPFTENDSYACAINAAMLFSPSRANGRFEERYLEIFQYVMLEFGHDIREMNLAEVVSSNSETMARTGAQIMTWIDSVLEPWLAAHREGLDRFPPA